MGLRLRNLEPLDARAVSATVRYVKPSNLFVLLLALLALAGVTAWIACAAARHPALGSRPAPSSTALAERHVRPFARSRIVNARGGGGPDDRL
jgi:hypothetical protein